MVIQNINDPWPVLMKFSCRQNSCATVSLEMYLPQTSCDCDTLNTNRMQLY